MTVHPPSLHSAAKISTKIRVKGAKSKIDSSLKGATSFQERILGGGELSLKIAKDRINPPRDPPSKVFQGLPPLDSNGLGHTGARGLPTDPGRKARLSGVEEGSPGLGRRGDRSQVPKLMGKAPVSKSSEVLRFTNIHKENERDERHAH